MALQLPEFWRLSRCSIKEGYKGGGRKKSTSTQPRTSRISQTRHAGLSLSASKLKNQEEITVKPMFEEGIFETNFRSVGTEQEEEEAYERVKNPEVAGDFAGGQGLVPEDWKYMQQDLHLKKTEKRLLFRMQERENAHLNDLRVQLRRQKIDLLSETGELPNDPSMQHRTQLLDRKQLVELERELTAKTSSSHLIDKELDEMFTSNEKYNLKRRIPDFSQSHCGKWPILHMLAASGQYFFLDQFLKMGVEVNLEDEDGYTPLQRAVQGRKETAVSQLLYAGAHVDVYDKDGANLLHMSVQINSLSLVRIFVKQGVSVNHADKYGWTPLHVAVMTGRADIVRHLLLSGADQSLTTKDGFTPLDIAFALGKDLNSYAVAKTLKNLSKVDLRA